MERWCRQDPNTGRYRVFYVQEKNKLDALCKQRRHSEPDSKRWRQLNKQIAELRAIAESKEDDEAEAQDEQINPWAESESSVVRQVILSESKFSMSSTQTSNRASAGAEDETWGDWT